jgi:hypothetical protein
MCFRSLDAPQFASYLEACRAALVSGERAKECVAVVRQLSAVLATLATDFSRKQKSPSLSPALAQPQDASSLARTDAARLHPFAALGLSSYGFSSSPAAGKEPPRLGLGLVQQLLAVLAEPQMGPLRLRLLCGAVLRLLAPCSLGLKSLGPPVEPRQLPLVLPVLAAQGAHFSLLPTHLPTVVNWASDTTGLAQAALPFLATAARYHRDYMEPVYVSRVATALCTLLTRARGTAGTLHDLDGALCADSYSPLLLGSKSLGQEHVAWAHAFAVVRLWLARHYVVAGHTGLEGEEEEDVEAEETGSEGGDAADPAARNAAGEDGAGAGAGGDGSRSRVASQGGHTTQTEGAKASQAHHTQAERRSQRSHDSAEGNTSASSVTSAGAMRGRAVAMRTTRRGSKAALEAPTMELPMELRETALALANRILEQTLMKMPQERAAQIMPASDHGAVVAVAIEATRILSHLCQIEPSLVPSVVPQLKRAMTRAAQEGRRRALLYAALLEFFLEHGAIVAFDLTSAFEVFFGRLFADSVPDQIFCAVVLRMLEHFVVPLRPVFTLYFPNLLKMLAWHPRTFLSQFLVLLPGMINTRTCVEMLHCLLDLPSLTAAMVQTRGKSLAEFTKSSPHPLANALYNYILRPEVRLDARGVKPGAR